MRLRAHAGFRLFWAPHCSDLGSPITTLADRAAVVIGAPLGGLLADTAGYRLSLWVCAGGVAVAGLVLLASPFRTAGRPVGVNALVRAHGSGASFCVTVAQSVLTVKGDTIGQPHRGGEADERP